MRYQVKTVRGAQAEQARTLGLVKIAKSSAEDLYNFGVPLVVVGSKVNSFHFFKGWHLAMHVDAQHYLSEGYAFQSFVNNWSQYNANSETGEIAFFVEEQYVGTGGRHPKTRRHRKAGY